MGADLLFQFGRGGRDACGGAGLSGGFDFRDGRNDVRGRGFGCLNDRSPGAFESGGRFGRRRGFRGVGRELVRRRFESAGAELDEFGEVGFGLGGLRGDPLQQVRNGLRRRVAARRGGQAPFDRGRQFRQPLVDVLSDVRFRFRDPPENLSEQPVSGFVRRGSGFRHQFRRTGRGQRSRRGRQRSQAVIWR